MDGNYIHDYIGVQNLHKLWAWFVFKTQVQVLQPQTTSLIKFQTHFLCNWRPPLSLTPPYLHLHYSRWRSRMKWDFVRFRSTITEIPWSCTLACCEPKWTRALNGRWILSNGCITIHRAQLLISLSLFSLLRNWPTAKWLQHPYCFVLSVDKIWKYLKFEGYCQKD